MDVTFALGNRVSYANKLWRVDDEGLIDDSGFRLQYEGLDLSQVTSAKEGAREPGIHRGDPPFVQRTRGGTGWEARDCVKCDKCGAHIAFHKSEKSGKWYPLTVHHIVKTEIGGEPWRSVSPWEPHFKECDTIKQRNDENMAAAMAERERQDKAQAYWALRQEHEQGQHTEFNPGCSDCVFEKAKTVSPEERIQLYDEYQRRNSSRTFGQEGMEDHLVYDHGINYDDIYHVDNLWPEHDRRHALGQENHVHPYGNNNYGYWNRTKTASRLVNCGLHGPTDQCYVSRAGKHVDSSRCTCFSVPSPDCPAHGGDLRQVKGHWAIEDHYHDPVDQTPWTTDLEPMSAWITAHCTNGDHKSCPGDNAVAGCDCPCHEAKTAKTGWEDEWTAPSLVG